MKKILTEILAAAAMLCSEPTMANDPKDYMYIPEDIILNEEGQASVYVWLKTNVVEYNTIIMNFYLPEGFSILKNSRNKYIFNWNTEEYVAPSHNITYADHDRYIRILGTSVKNEYLLPGNHWLFNFTIQAPEWFNSDAIASFRDIEFSEGTVRNHYFDDVDFVIRRANVGLKDVSVDYDDNDEIYNLQGIRVQAPLSPGFYIINGEKRFVK